MGPADQDNTYCSLFSGSWQAHYCWTRIKPLCLWFRLKKRLSVGYPLVQIAACSTKLFPTIISWHSLVCRGVRTHSNDRSQGWEGCREALFSPTWCYVWMEFRPKIKLFGKPGGFKRWNLGASSPQGNCD